VIENSAFLTAAFDKIKTAILSLIGYLPDFLKEALGFKEVAGNVNAVGDAASDASGNVAGLNEELKKTVKTGASVNVKPKVASASSLAFAKDLGTALSKVTIPISTVKLVKVPIVPTIEPSTVARIGSDLAKMFSKVKLTDGKDGLGESLRNAFLAIDYDSLFEPLDDAANTAAEAVAGRFRDGS